MRPTLLAGALLVAAGVFLVLRPPSYTREESMFKLGGIEAKVDQEHELPGWVGGALAGAGVVLLVLGLGKRRH